MNNLIYILIIGISLSMDAFSLALSLGTFKVSNKDDLKLSLVVGIFHFLMPILGAFLGSKINKVLLIDGNLILGIILIIISINLFIQIYKKEEVTLNFDIYGIVLFAFGVSLDSFSVGVALAISNYNIELCGLIFALCSFIFTYLGVIIGKYSNKILGKSSSILGSTLLLIIGIIHLF